jgi:hypothetical protein
VGVSEPVLGLIKLHKTKRAGKQKECLFGVDSSDPTPGITEIKGSFCLDSKRYPKEAYLRALPHEEKRGCIDVFAHQLHGSDGPDLPFI